MVGNCTFERRILAPTCLLSQPNVLSYSPAPRVCPLIWIYLRKAGFLVALKSHAAPHSNSS